tara:strand:+ start:3635 stop:3841 length:207 start_codon:yes stop_codon:yes gene_type:complete
MNIEDPSKERASIRRMAKDLVEVVNSTTNDYDATDLVERELWDHYSGLPNPNWYDTPLNEDDYEKEIE